MGIVPAIQTPSIYLDSMACAQRTAERIAEVAEHDAWLAVFPETFIPGDPLYHDYAMLDSEPFRVLERRFAQQAITVPGPETECIAAACRTHHMTVAIGVTERPARAGTLYNTLLYFGPDGTILGRHDAAHYPDASGGHRWFDLLGELYAARSPCALYAGRADPRRAYLKSRQ